MTSLDKALFAFARSRSSRGSRRNLNIRHSLRKRFRRQALTRAERLPVLLLADPVLLELLVQIRARGADGGGGGRDVPLVLLQLRDQERALGGLLEVA